MSATDPSRGRGRAAPDGDIRARPASVTRTISSPLGPLQITAEAGGLRSVAFASGGTTAPPADGAAVELQTLLHDTAAWLETYWAGGREPCPVPLAAVGTAWQRRVWALLREIPWGAVVTYGDLAERLGRPGAARAVGAAVGQNPWVVVLPCHRVMGRAGSLTGYGGGLPRKIWLFRHEGRLLA